MSPAEQFETLVKAGIYTSDGKLTAPYSNRSELGADEVWEDCDEDGIE